MQIEKVRQLINHCPYPLFFSMSNAIGESSSPRGSLRKTAHTDVEPQDIQQSVSLRVKVSAIFTVVFSGIALFSDGYSAAVISNLNLLFAEIYDKTYFNSTVKTRLSNAFLIGEIFGMLFFGLLIDQIGRKAGVILATTFLVLGIALSAASEGVTPGGLFWMLIITRSLAGVGAGGEYPTCGTNATEASDEQKHTRNMRGFLIAMVGDFAIDFGFVLGGIVPLIVLACFNYSNYPAVWRTCLALGLIPPLSVIYMRIKFELDGLKLLI